jgi:hypothetical protein
LPNVIRGEGSVDLSGKIRGVEWIVVDVPQGVPLSFGVLQRGEQTFSRQVGVHLHWLIKTS